MKVRNVVIIAVAGLVVIELLTLYYRKEPIEQELRSRTEQVLEEHGVSIGQVSFDGRDARLIGNVTTEEEKRQVERIVREVAAIRAIDNQLVVEHSDVVPDSVAEDLLLVEDSTLLLPAVEDSTMALPAASFRLAQAGADTLVVEGIMPDAAIRDRLIVATRRAFPGLIVNDSISLDSLVNKAAWLNTLPALIPAIGKVAVPVLEVDSAGVKLSGNVRAAEQRDAILADASRVLDGALALNADLRLVKVDESTEGTDLEALKAQIEELLAAKRIQFRINTAELADISKLVLNEVADLLNEAPDVQVEVEGHTDNIGSVAMNNALSQSRADAVRLYLISRGVDASRLTAVGYGPSRPVASNATLEGRIYNRRVVFSLKGGS